MSYVAVQEEGSGGSVHFAERVTDAEYRKGRRP